MRIIIIGAGTVGMMIIHHITTEHLIITEPIKEERSEKKLITKEFIIQRQFVVDNEIILSLCEPSKKDECPICILVITRNPPSWYHALWTKPPFVVSLILHIKQPVYTDCFFILFL